MSRLLLLLAIMLSLAACDSQEPDVPEFGRFDVAISGDLARDLEGDATFSSVVGFTGERVLTLNLMDRPASTQLGRIVGITDYQGRIDGEGTYDLDASRLDGISLTYFDQAGDLSAVWLATSGALRVTRFEDDFIEGEVTATLQGFMPNPDVPSGSATLRGSFEAVALPDLQQR